jgi:transcription antitermination factor NusG
MIALLHPASVHNGGWIWSKRVVANSLFGPSEELRQAIRARFGPPRLSFYPLRVKPRCELRIARGLVDQGLEKRDCRLIVPVGKKWVRKHARTKQRRKVDYALYERYVFIGVTGWDDYYWAKATPVGHLMQGFVGRAGPEPVSARDLAFLESLPGMAFGDAATKTNVHKALRAGDTAEIVEGALAGQRGEAVEIDEERIKVMLQIFDAWRVVDVPASSVEPA